MSEESDLKLTEDNEIVRLSDGKTIAIYKPDETGEDAIQFAHWQFKNYTDAILALIEEGPTPEEPEQEQEAPPEPEETPGWVGALQEEGQFKGYPVQTSAGDLTPGWPEAVLKFEGKEAFRTKYKNGMRLVRYNKLRASRGLEPIN